MCRQILGAMRIGGDARSQLMLVRRACLQRLGEVYRSRQCQLNELAASLPALAPAEQPDQGGASPGERLDAGGSCALRQCSLLVPLLFLQKHVPCQLHIKCCDGFP